VRRNYLHINWLSGRNPNRRHLQQEGHGEIRKYKISKSNL